MALPTGVYQRGAVFYIQIKVPSDLKTAWPTPFFVRKCLKTTNRDEATAQGHRLWADATDAFAQARARLRPTIPIKLTPPLLELLHERIRYAALKADDAMRYDPATLERVWPLVQASLPTLGALSKDRQERFQQMQDAQYVWSKALALSAARGSTNAGRMAADMEAHALGISVDWDGEIDALIALTRTTVQAYADAAQRSVGEPIATPTLRPTPADLTESPKVPKNSKGSSKKLGDVLADWKAAKKPTQDSIDRTERALKHFAASGQDLPLSTLKRTHGAAFRAWLLHDDRPFASKTGLNYWQALTALLNIARDVGDIELNPWQGMTFEVTDSKQRQPFTDEDLRRLFGTTLHLQGDWPVVNKVGHWDAYFCMLLLLWTGARVGELAQLETADVMVQNGLTVFRIHEEAEGSTVKGGSTSASVRTLPVPPDLIRLGFLERIDNLRECGEAKLFPTFHRAGAVTPGEIMSEWFRPFRVTVGAATGALNGTHRFRHTIRTRLNALGIAEATADALTGHAAQGNAGRRIYTHVQPATVLAALERMTWPLEFPRVYGK